MDPKQTPPPRDPYRDRPQRHDPLNGPGPRDPLFEEGHGADHDDHAAYGAPPPPRARSRGFDPASLFVLLDGIRRAVPGELEERVTGLIREFLMTLRSLIDWYLDRLDRPEREPRVEDIPID